MTQTLQESQAETHHLTRPVSAYSASTLGTPAAGAVHSAHLEQVLAAVAQLFWQHGPDVQYNLYRLAMCRIRSRQRCRAGGPASIIATDRVRIPNAYFTDAGDYAVKIHKFFARIRDIKIRYMLQQERR